MVCSLSSFLVSCFSDHPLIHMLREVTTKPVVGIFEAAVSLALMLGRKFGIVSTGVGWKPGIISGIRNYLGAHASERFAGVVTTGLGVVELKEGDPERIKRRMAVGAQEVARKGAEVILLGCAGQ
jgi:Asp/Glu/hydantoin racemase